MVNGMIYALPNALPNAVLDDRNVIEEVLIPARNAELSRFLHWLTVAFHTEEQKTTTSLAQRDSGVGT
jgi:hypothetical protein